MSVKGKRTIWAGCADLHGHALNVEGIAQDAFLPGTLVEKTGDELATTAAAATVFGKKYYIAREYGDHTDQDVDTAYEVDSNALALDLRSGEFANVLVVAAAVLVEGQTGLSSNGDGTLKVAATDGTEDVLFMADESLTVGGSAELVRVRKY